MKTIAVAIALLVALPASATPAGRRQYELGARAFHDKRWADARRAFQAAYDLDHEAELLYDLALVTARQANSDGNPELLSAARETYQRYLAQGTLARRRKQAEAALAAIDAQLATARPAPPEPTKPSPPPPRAADERVPLDPYGEAPPVAPRPAPPVAAPPPPVAAPARLAPAAPSPPPRTDLTAPSSPSPPHRRWVTPVVVVGVLAAVGLAIGLGVGLSGSSSSLQATKAPSLGTVNYPQ